LTIQSFFLILKNIPSNRAVSLVDGFLFFEEHVN